MSQALPKAPFQDHGPAQPLAVGPAVVPPAPQPAPAAERSQRSFLRMVSHELRTPLNAIIGFSEIISGELCGPIPPQYREYGEIIRSSGGRMLKLVNQVLEIVKLESGAMELDPHAEPVDLIFADAARACTEDLQARDLDLQIQVPNLFPHALADAKAVRMAMVNLIQNAAAYAPEGGTVRLVAESQGPLVRLSVEDDGDGLDPADLPRLMRPFEQGENALVRRVEGAGLGWAIVDLVCKAMGGAFEVRTAPGQGLSASLVLRRAS